MTQQKSIHRGKTSIPTKKGISSVSWQKGGCTKNREEDILLLVGEHEGDGDENKKGGRRRMSRKDERRKNGRIEGGRDDNETEEEKGILPWPARGLLAPRGFRVRTTGIAFYGYGTGSPVIQSFMPVLAELTSASSLHRCFFSLSPARERRRERSSMRTKTKWELFQVVRWSKSHRFLPAVFDNTKILLIFFDFLVFLSRWWSVQWRVGVVTACFRNSLRFGRYLRSFFQTWTYRKGLFRKVKYCFKKCCKKFEVFLISTVKLNLRLIHN